MSKIINALITIDTDKVVKTKSKNTDRLNPVSIGKDYAYMVASGTEVISGQGTWDLKFTANTGDLLRGFAVSASNNFEDAVLLYGFTSISPGTSVTTKFKYERFPRLAVVGGKEDPLPAEGKSPNLEDAKFWFFQAGVNDYGTVTYNVNFALYTRDKDENPELYGYYSWDPTIVVKKPEPK